MKTTQHPHRVASLTGIILVAGALSAGSIPARAQAPPERMSDKDVKTLIDQVDETRDKFEGNLDNQFKNSKFSGPNGETHVSALLQDYQDNTKKLQDRFSEDNAAGAEVAAVLKQAAAVRTLMQGTSSVQNGRREWDAAAASLTHLASAYGTTFPMLDGGTARRMNDKETGAAAAAMATAAERFKDEIDDSKILPKPDKDVGKKDVEVLIKQAEAVKDHTHDGTPSTGEVRQLASQVTKIATFASAHQIPATTNWQTVQASLVKLQQAFALTK
jgi:hypothetical protein